MALKGILTQNAQNIFPPSADISMGGFKITNLGTPTVGTDAANKAYVDTFVSGLTPLTACVVKTTAALTATYANGASGVGATLTNSSTQAAITIDGVALSSTQRVLVNDQVAPAQNGIYTVTTVGSGASNWVLTRATDFDTSAEMLEGSYTNITSGTTNQGGVWIFTTSAPIVVGTTALNFGAFGIFGTMASQNANAVAITGGNINGTIIGGSSPAAATFTTLNIANGAIVTGGSITFSGAFGFTGTVTGATTVTFPTTGTLATLAGTETLTNKTITGTVNPQTGTTYTLVAADFRGKVTASNGSAQTYTLPQQSTLTTAAGVMCYLENIGAGTVTLVKEGSETLLGNTTLATGATAIIYRDTTTTWSVFGGTATLNMAGINFVIQTVANNTYVLMGYVGTPITILGVYQKARAITTAGTFSININGSGITSLTAVVPSTAGSYTTATGANTCVRGDQVTIVYSGTSLVLDHNIDLDITQQF